MNVKAAGPEARVATYVYETEVQTPDGPESVFESVYRVAYVEQGPTHLVFRDGEGKIILGLRASDVVSFFEED